MTIPVSSSASAAIAGYGCKNSNIAIGFVFLCVKGLMCSNYGCILNGSFCIKIGLKVKVEEYVTCGILLLLLLLLLLFSHVQTVHCDQIKILIELHTTNLK
jgi:hypothetical protein